MGRKEGYAPPVAIASFSMAPAIIAWLNKYAHEHKTTKSWIVRKALLDFQEKYDPKKWTCKGCGTTIFLDMFLLGLLPLRRKPARLSVRRIFGDVRRPRRYRFQAFLLMPPACLIAHFGSFATLSPYRGWVLNEVD